MEDKVYFSHLFEIARHLNKEFSLPSALQQALKRTAEILNLKSGWIWLTEPNNQTVYLAASYQLPTALNRHPERLSGWCYCIKHYLSDRIEEATNISEIKCTRFKDISANEGGLQFHATIPIIIDGKKIGLMNLLSEEKRQFTEKQLSILNSISELIGIAVQRTRLQESYLSDSSHSQHALENVINRILKDRLHTSVTNLNHFINNSNNVGYDELYKVKDSIEMLKSLQEELQICLQEMQPEKQSGQEQEFHYPTSPLTSRELEVLQAVRTGQTNQQIAGQLYITERTVKFHITSILSKLYAKTRTEAVDIALKRGLL